MVLPSLSVFADQKDAKELLDRANEGVKGKVSVKLEDQVAMIRGLQRQARPCVLLREVRGARVAGVRS